LSPKKRRYARFSTISRAAQHRHVPGKHSVAGPWRRNATPQQVSGTLVCSYGLAAVTWDHRANPLVSDVHVDRAGPALNQLDQRWSAHS